MTDPNQNGHSPRLSAADLADKTRFQFRESVLDLPELGGSITLKTLSVREREVLRAPIEEAQERNESGDPTEAAIKSAGKVFSTITVDPKVTPDEAAAFIGDWPVEAFDRVTEAYAELIGSREEEKAAYAEFQEEDDDEVRVSPGA
jgi:hypothetical protein